MEPINWFKHLHSIYFAIQVSLISGNKKKSLETATAPLQDNIKNLKYFCLTAA